MSGRPNTRSLGFHNPTSKAPATFNPQRDIGLGITIKTPKFIKKGKEKLREKFSGKNSKPSQLWSLGKVFFVSMGAIMIYGLLTNIALLNNGIYTLDPAAHNLAYIISAIVSGGAMAFACFNFVDQEAVYTSPVDAILAYFHGRPDTSFWHTVSRVLGHLAGAFVMAGVLFIVYQDKARVKLAATVVNPLNIPTNGDSFTAFSFETIGTLVLALVTFTLDSQHRRAADRALIKGIIVIVLRLAMFQYTTASFNVFLSLAMNATTNQWSTFAAGTYWIFWVAGVTALVLGIVIIKIQKEFRLLFKKHFHIESKANIRDDTPPKKSNDGFETIGRDGDDESLISVSTGN